MKAIGIDLGTTNSAVAAHDPHRGDIAVLTNSKGDRLTPSVVGLVRRDGKEQTIVGEDALNWAVRQPRDTIVSVKRLMGRDFADTSVAEARDRLSYEIVPGPDDDPRAHVTLGGRTRKPAEISSVILDKLVRDAARTLGEQVTHAVITVPAYFRDAQRAATREAAERAGLVVKKIVTSQYERAKAIIEENRDTMIRLAECLLERESLDGVEIRRIVAGLPLDENPTVGSGNDEDRPQLKEPTAKPLKPILPPITGGNPQPA